MVLSRMCSWQILLWLGTTGKFRWLLHMFRILQIGCWNWTPTGMQETFFGLPFWYLRITILQHLTTISAHPSRLLGNIHSPKLTVRTWKLMLGKWNVLLGPGFRDGNLYPSVPYKNYLQGTILTDVKSEGIHRDHRAIDSNIRLHGDSGWNTFQPDFFCGILFTCSSFLM